VPGLQYPLKKLIDRRPALESEFQLAATLEELTHLLNAQLLGFVHLECHSPEA
jgi:hypothetical protein